MACLVSCCLVKVKSGLYYGIGGFAMHRVNGPVERDINHLKIVSKILWICVDCTLFESICAEYSEYAIYLILQLMVASGGVFIVFFLSFTGVCFVNYRGKCLSEG